MAASTHPSALCTPLTPFLKLVSSSRSHVKNSDAHGERAAYQTPLSGGPIVINYRYVNIRLNLTEYKI